jgi:hypothetical protein
VSLCPKKKKKKKKTRESNCKAEVVAMYVSSRSWTRKENKFSPKISRRKSPTVKMPWDF